jgi:hypothetical protein
MPLHCPSGLWGELSHLTAGEDHAAHVDDMEQVGVPGMEAVRLTACCAGIVVHSTCGEVVHSHNNLLEIHSARVGRLHLLDTSVALGSGRA